jgi:hypothetical protein
MFYYFRAPKPRYLNLWIATLVTSAREDELVATISCGRGPLAWLICFEFVILCPQP